MTLFCGAFPAEPNLSPACTVSFNYVHANNNIIPLYKRRKCASNGITPTYPNISLKYFTTGLK